MNDFDTFTKLPKNGEDWGKLIVAKGFKRLSKVKNIAQSGHTANIKSTSFEIILKWPNENGFT